MNRRAFLKTAGLAPAIIAAGNLMPVWRKPAPEIFTGYDLRYPFDYQVGSTYSDDPATSSHLADAQHGETAIFNGEYWMYVGPPAQGEWRKLGIKV